ncbi:MAG: hypothetical protein JNL94_16560 [Planctomycetes bacterium]|nr:hypothetical protein [Planctomycetota bacterium]
MIGALLLAIGLVDGGAWTWRVLPLTPRVGDTIVLEGVLEPTPHDDVAVADPGTVTGLIETGEFELRRDGLRLVLSRTYVAAASGEVELPRTIVRGGAAQWSARPARLDVTAVEPGRLGRELVDPLRPIALDEPSDRRFLIVGLGIAAAVALLLWLRVAARRTGSSGAIELEPGPSQRDAFVERLDAITSAFAAGAVPVAATSDALRDLLRDVLAARVDEPARARTSAELATLVARAGPRAAFSTPIFEAVEAQCYGPDHAADASRVARWLESTRSWLTTTSEGA